MSAVEGSVFDQLLSAVEKRVIFTSENAMSSSCVQKMTRGKNEVHDNQTWTCVKKKIKPSFQSP